VTAAGLSLPEPGAMPRAPELRIIQDPVGKGTQPVERVVEYQLTNSIKPPIGLFKVPGGS
jgi:hypothetical protein